MFIETISRRGFPVFDVRARTLNFAPRNAVVWETHSTVNVYVEAAGKLFLMSEVCFEALDPPPPPPSRRHYIVHGGPKPNKWKWRLLPTPPFLDTDDAWGTYDDVVAHAVHPDGQMLFFSTSKYDEKAVESGTFSFDTVRSAWACHGAWRLPFDGRGYFDRDLDAWVGLPGLVEEAPDTLGHLCASQVPGGAADDNGPPAWKLSKEKLFCTDPTEKHIGATLVYLGGGSRFCVVQRLQVRESKTRRRSRRRRKVQMLRITTFFLKYDMNGDLRVHTYGRVRSYKLPETAYEYRDVMENPVAFWL